MELRVELEDRLRAGAEHSSPRSDSTHQAAGIAVNRSLILGNPRRMRRAPIALPFQNVRGDYGRGTDPVWWSTGDQQDEPRYRETELNSWREGGREKHRYGYWTEDCTSE